VDDVALALAADLLDTMAASPACVGLAAPQIGVGLRAFVVDVTGHRKARSCHGAFVLFDPEITIDPEIGIGPALGEADADVSAAAATGHPDGEFELAREGCMSVPDLTGDVARLTRVTVTGLGVDGERHTYPVDAFEARAVLHEIDHLDGLVFLDRVIGPHALFPRKVYR
jgi:peptide deformylase